MLTDVRLDVGSFGVDIHRVEFDAWHHDIAGPERAQTENVEEKTLFVVVDVRLAGVVREQVPEVGRIDRAFASGLGGDEACQRGHHEAVHTRPEGPEHLDNDKPDRADEPGESGAPR